MRQGDGIEIRSALRFQGVYPERSEDTREIRGPEGHGDGHGGRQKYAGNFHRTGEVAGTGADDEGRSSAPPAKLSGMQFTETRVRVRYAETDQMGVVYYANYLVWMEVGRVEYCKARGFRYRDMELEDGVLLAVIEAQCRYLFPARFDEDVMIETRIAKANSRAVSFGYEMRLVDGRKLATGSTRH